jgi:hypothetical protein
MSRLATAGFFLAMPWRWLGRVATRIVNQGRPVWTNAFLDAFCILVVAIGIFGETGMWGTKLFILAMNDKMVHAWAGFFLHGLAALTLWSLGTGIGLLVWRAVRITSRGHRDLWKELILEQESRTLEHQSLKVTHHLEAQLPETNHPTRQPQRL